MNMNKYLDVAPEVKEALAAGKPVVALESTIISHGMPYPQNVETALKVESIIRENGAVPATIAVLGGRLKAGLSPEEIDYLGKAGAGVAKASRRDLPVLAAQGKDGATTVTTTMIIAHMAGIQVFATGGIGGVHRGAETTMDISADLEELARTPVMVVCAGAKSILDLGLTLEYLETHGVPVIGYGTEELPAFYTRKSGFGVDYRIDTPADLAKLCAGVEERSGAKLTVTEMEGGVEVHCLGKNAHAAMPDGGINAIQALPEVLARLPLADCPSTKAVRAMAGLFPFGDTRGKALGIAQSDHSGDLTLNLALITLTGAGFTAKFDARVPVCATKENCADVCEENLGKCGIQVLDAREMMATHVVEADSPLVKTLLQCYSDVTGEEDPQPIAIGGGTYVHDIPGGVAFGCDFPGFDPKMHSANEQASVENLLKSAKIFALAIARLCA